MLLTNITHPVFSTGCEVSYLRRTSTTLRAHLYNLLIFMPLAFRVAAV